MATLSRTTALDGAKPRRNPLGRYTPTRINAHSRWRFLRSRRAELIQRIGGGPPNERQALAIDMLAKSEWAVVVAEHDATAALDARARVEPLRIAGDARKQVLLWHRELTAVTPRPAVDIEPPGAALDRHLRMLAERHAAGHGEDAAA